MLVASNINESGLTAILSTCMKFILWKQGFCLSAFLCKKCHSQSHSREKREFSHLYKLHYSRFKNQIKLSLCAIWVGFYGGLLQLHVVLHTLSPIPLRLLWVWRTYPLSHSCWIWSSTLQFEFHSCLNMLLNGVSFLTRDIVQHSASQKLSCIGGVTVEIRCWYQDVLWY